MTLEQIYERMKKENPYYNGSQAQKEEEVGMVVKGNTINHTTESSKLREEYNNQRNINYNEANDYNLPIKKEKRSYEYINIPHSSNKKNFNNKVFNLQNAIETPSIQSKVKNIKSKINNDNIIKSYKDKIDEIYRSKEYADLQTWLNTNGQFKKEVLTETYNKNQKRFEELQDEIKQLNFKIDDIKKENIDLSEVTDTDRLLAPLNSAYTGVQSTVRGIGNAINRMLGNKELLYDGITPEEYKAQKIREKQNGMEKIVTDISQSAGQMAALAPLSAVPYVGKYLSLAGLGLSSAGESYKQALEEGKSDKEALKYGAIHGISEAGMQKLLGGVKIFGESTLGKATNGKVNKILDKVIKSDAGKKSVNYISDMLGEGTEEYLQSVLEPVYRNISFNENNKINPLDEEALYSGLIGSLSAGAMNVPSYIASKNKANVEFPVANENNRYTKSSLDEMLNNKELPMQSYQYEKSENTKINALRQDANKYFNNTEQSHNFVNMLEKIITDKNVEIKFDANLKTPDGRVANGSYSNGVITINPNSNKAGEFIAIHELTHAIGTDSMKNIIETYRKSNTEFDTSVKKLLQNYNSSEITEEALSDVSAQLFGNQEFINNIAQNNPNIFQKIYSEIKYLWHQFRGYKNQNQFVEDLYYKWTQAYNNNNTLNKTTNYSIAGKKSLENIKDNSLLRSRGINSYNNAINLAKQNIDNEQIRQKTGWFQDKNGDWKYEFSDKYMSLKNIKIQKDKTYKLGDILEHDTLFTLYPEVENYKVEINDNIKANASFDRRNNTITINSKLIKNNKSLEGTLIHEIQHAIQNIENFERGTSTKGSKLKYYNSLGEIEATETKGRFLKEKYQNKNMFPIAPESSKANPQHKDLNKYLKNRNLLDKVKDSMYNYFNKRGVNNYDVSEEIVEKNRTQNNSLVDERKRLEPENNSGSFNLKEKQLEVINKNNPMQDDYHTGIRTIEDIKTLEETIQDEEWAAYDEYNPDLSRQDIENAIKAGKITVYSSYPIKQGVFVSPSRMEAESYSGNGKVYSKEVNINDVAWIDPTQGQYAEIDNKKYSQSNQSWQKYLEENFKSEGTRTNLQDIKLPTKEWIENRQKLKKSQNNIPIAKEYINKNTLNPLQISNLTENDVTTTPKLPDIKYKTDKGNKSKFYNNLMNKTGMLNDDVRNLIKNENDIKYYEGVTNVQSLREANERLQKNGSKETFRWFSKDLSDENTTVSATEVAEGWILLKQYQDAGDYESAVKVAKRMRDMATKSGQALQAYSIQARLTPEGMFQYAQSELKDAFERFSKNKTQDWINKHKQDFDLKPEETQAIINKVKEAQNLPNDSYEKKEKLAEIQKIMTDKLPPERGAGIKSWMRISMLFNPKTQVRNILGNAIVSPVNAVGDVVSSIADKALAKKTGVRTVGLSNPVQNIKGFKKGLYESYNDFKKGINTREISGDRFEIGQGKAFKGKGLGKALNRVDQLLNFMLDAGDRPFYEATFNNSINNQLILNNTDIVTQDMIDIATNEALSRTWQDNNNYTKFVLSIRNAFNGKFDMGKIHTKGFRYGLGDVLIPFAKTPANLTKAIVDYSPIGLVNSLVEGNNIRKAIGRSDLTAQQQHKFVQDLGKATAGTMLYVIGYALAKAGITSGESDEDKDVANFMKNNLGTTQYSIKIGNKTFTYDWAQPIAAPIAMMANLANKDSQEDNLLEEITSVLDIPMNMILEQSFMQSIQEVLSNNGGVIEGVIQQVLDLPSRAVPTFLKQITDMTDTTQRASYEKGKPIQTAVNQVKAKIPGLSKQLAPVSNTLGNDIKKYGGETNPFLYAFHTFLNPANVNSNQKNRAGSEIYKVYEKTGDKTIFPRQAEYTQIIDGTKITLTSNERYQYQKTSGKYYSNVVNELLKSASYKNLSNENKAEILKEIATDSNEKAKEELAKNKNLEYERQKTDVKIEELVNNGLEYSNAYIYKTQIKDIEGDKDNKGKTISSSSTAKKAKYIMDMDTNNTQKDKLLSLLSDTDTKVTVSDLKKLNGNYLTYMQQSGKKDDKGISARDKYMIYIDAGIPVTTLNKYYDEIGDIEGIKNSNGKTISGSKKKALFNYINSLSLNATQKKILFTKCNSSYGKNYKSEIHAYINSLNISKQRKEQIWNELYD